MKGHSQNSLVVNPGIVLFLVVASFYFPFSTGKCILENGKAVPLDSLGKYHFSCNKDYYMSGQSIALCNPFSKPSCYLFNPSTHALCLGKLHPCTDDFGIYDACYCDKPSSGLDRNVQCFQRRWTAEPCRKGCASLGWPSSAHITYNSVMIDSLYAFGTVATYECSSVVNGFNPASAHVTRQCTRSGWSASDVPCTCPGLEIDTDVTDIHYIPLSPQIANGSNPVYRVGTLVMYCKGTKPMRYRRRCTIHGWSHSISNEECRSSTLRQPGSPTLRQPEPRSTTRHKEDERTLIIVSGTTGAILSALIIVVIIVSCQRRIRYHRMMRARTRCRQDQDAFAAFITYHRDIHCMLPSYDEAVNQEDHGEPPSFDEAVANTDRPSPNDPSPVAPEVSQSLESPNPIPTESESVVINTPSAEQAPAPSGAEGRFFRGLRMLFGGQGFTTRGVYCHLVPHVDEHENECADNEGASDEAAAADFNEALSRAGLC